MPRNLYRLLINFLKWTAWTVLGLFCLSWLVILIQMCLPANNKPVPPPPPDRTPTVFYVGSHAFKVPADYSSLTAADYGGPGNTHLIFEFYYPAFTAPYDDPRFIADEGTPRIDNDLIEIYIDSGETGVPDGIQRLNSIRASKNGDKATPGPYGLFTIHQNDPSEALPDLIGVDDGVGIDLWCDNPAINPGDPTNPNSCSIFYFFQDLLIGEFFSLSNLPHWKEIHQKTVQFLTTHEVQ